MVIRWMFIFILFNAFVGAQMAVESVIKQNQAVANQKIEGIVTITHEESEKINLDSFQLAGKPLSVKLKDEKKTARGLIISNYSFELDPKDKGLYELPPVSLEINGKRYESVATTYEVKASSVEMPQVTSNHPSSIVFNLEAFVDGPSPLYPGQRAKLVYRIAYNQSIDLAASKFPLLYTTEFKKIGDEQFKDYQYGALTVQEIIQEIEAAQPGTYHYPPSFIDGYAYRMRYGLKVYEPTKLHAEAPAVEIVVAEFPKSDTPASFTGSLGKISGQLKMLTSPTLKMGDRIILELAVAGPTNLSDVSLPDLKCQPGFSGFFHLSDLPPAGKVKNNEKVFQIELRPISRFVKEVPSIELSAFDTVKKTYHRWQSEPIPIQLSIPPLEENVLNNQPKLVNFFDLFSEVVKRANPDLPVLVYPSAVTVTFHDIATRWMRTPLVLWLIPLLGIAILWQSFMQRRQQIVPFINSQKTSEQYLYEAFRQRKMDRAISLLHEAFGLRLKEKGKEEMPQQVHVFLSELDAFRYGLAKDLDRDKIRKEAQDLYNQIN